MNESNEILWSKLKVGDWVFHSDVGTSKIYAWRVCNIETKPSMLVLAREQLSVKKFKLERGSYIPGNANCTSIIAPVAPSRTFTLAPSQYPEQFHWIKQEQEAYNEES